MADTEEQLISKARDAVSQCNWVVGECASQWTQRYAKGRTDGDFGQMVGLSGDQIYQRRRVWESFGESYRDYPGLKWSFFYVALNWDDASDCLQWAQQSDATVAEMRAWRRAQRGEDLFTESSDGYSEWAAPLSGFDTAHIPLSAVVDPSEYTPSGMGPRAGLESGDREAAATMGMVARDSGENYAPFRSDASSVPTPQKESGTAVAERPELTPEQFWKRAANMLAKLNSALEPQLLNALEDQPDNVREKLAEAFRDLADKLEGKLD
ncbi:MAG: hypothetical protein KDA96_04440 [Planctomycetaceae bacterium]|nr:hypothetical protein [Planctomycetaceae bacterium]